MNDGYFLPKSFDGGLPPGEIRIEDLRVEPMDDGRRVKIFIVITPFRKAPNMDINILDYEGNLRASTHIIEFETFKMTLTMHMPAAESWGEYTLEATLYYSEEGQVDSRQVKFNMANKTNI